VVFQPLADGKAAGPFIVFADGFAGAVKEPGRAAFRPSGLAMGPDGALYISEDMHGRIWRVTYHGAADAAPTPAPAPKAAGVTSGEPGPPEGTHPDAGRTVLASLPLPAGATAEQVALGERIFHGEAADGTCAGCHGSDANGSPQGPSLVSGKWLDTDGTFAGSHHHRWRAEAEELIAADAAARRCAADRCRCHGGRRLCLGHQPPEREIMAGVNSSPEHDSENRVPLFRIML
jgi:mono/diheme cytochrome c family protein